jgi:hypothetical protein
MIWQYYYNPNPLGNLLSSGIYMIVGLVELIIGIVLCIWVYKDSQNHGKDPTKWCLIVFFCGWLGCICYLVKRDDPYSS